MKELLLECRFKNNRLLRAINKQFRAVSDFSSMLKMNKSSLYGLINLRVFPYYRFRKKDDRVLPIPSVVSICSYFDSKPEFLFPPAIYIGALGGNGTSVQHIEMSLKQARIMAHGGQRFIPDDSQVKAIEWCRKESIRKAMASLTDRERKILTLRFGLETGIPLTLKEISRRYGICSERVRQTEGKAIRRLRHPSRTSILRDAY